MRTIENYGDFCSAMWDKLSEDRAVRNEAKNALGNFRIRDPKRFEDFKARYEGIVPTTPVPSPTPVESPTPKVVRQTTKRIPKCSLMTEQQLHEKARETLLKDGLEAGYSIPRWVTFNDVMISFSKLKKADLLTANRNLIQRKTILRKCILLAAADGRVDEEKLRTLILSHCRTIWKKLTIQPDYSFEAVKWFVLKVASAEELANANLEYSINMPKIIGLIFDNRIKKLNIEELKEIDLKQKVEKLKSERPKDIRKLAKKAFNYIEKNNKANDGFPLPDNCELQDLKAAIDEISDDDLLSIYNGKRIEADKLYELCIRVISNSNV